MSSHGSNGAILFNEGYPHIPPGPDIMFRGRLLQDQDHDYEAALQSYQSHRQPSTLYPTEITGTS
ncbi:hypothetical protein AZE42_08020 [Rhizopogon vesiculosus]|uniref:Uncharacterized protein n=1 Tax=Rhizopogon vesiculosus TaxID=180088 RepID=A0A1J8PG89_9AGAM|nr:hypothetical protein AZE42_08020 [Rhizopogon vesiculosus]